MKKTFTILSILSITLISFLSFAQAFASSFKIEEVEVIERDIIELSFTRELNSNLDAVREFIIEKTDTMEDIEVLLSDVDASNPTLLTLMLSDFLEENTDYTITVLDISDVDGNTIEAWVDSIFTFNTWSFTLQFQETPEHQEEEVVEIDEVIEDTPEQIELVEDDILENLNSAPEHADVDHTWLWGTTTTSDEAAPTLTYAENNDALPDTWPELFLILILTLLFAGWISYYKNQRA